MPDYLGYYRDRVPGLRKEGTEFRARCPIHQGSSDTSFSLDPETWRWCCHGGCEGGDKYELEMKLSGDTFPKAKRTVDALTGEESEPIPIENARKKKSWGKLVATYPYLDPDGTLLYEVVRYEPKDFRQRRPDGKGGWVWSIKGLERTLYHLPEVLTSTGTVYLCEGEKDVDAVRDKLHLTATCNSGGAGKFTAYMARFLKGRDVVILRDMDGPGLKHAEQAATLLRLEGCRVKVVDLPAKDPAAWLDGGGTIDQLAELQGATPEWTPGAAVAETGPSELACYDGMPANVHEMLENYTILVGSDMVWDHRLGRTTNASEMRLAHMRDFNAWARHDDVRKVDIDKLVFKPQGCAPDELNLFKGMRLQPDPSKPCDRLKEHLAFMCGGDLDLAHWLTCWLAYPLQHPGAKMRTAVVMHGAQGTGKSLLFEAMLKVYGEYGDIVSQAEIDSPYTGWASRKLFVIADEVEANPRASRTRNRLKSIITGDLIGIEEKYRQRRVEENHMNLVFLSNEDTPVIVESGDRRYTIIHVDETHVRDSAYYRALVQETKTGGVAGFYHYLLNYDVKDFDENTWPYETEAKWTLQEVCQHSADRFIDLWICRDLPVPYGCTTAADLYEAYRTWCFVNGERQTAVTETKFGTIVAKRKWPKVRERIGERRVYVHVPDGTLDLHGAVTFNEKLGEWIHAAQARKL